MPAFPDKSKGMKAVGRILSVTLAQMFELPNVQHKSYQKFEAAFADTLMREHIQRLIIARTKLNLIEQCPDVVPGLRKRFEHEVSRGS
jgi:hypothetical protein